MSIIENISPEIETDSIPEYTTEELTDLYGKLQREEISEREANRRILVKSFKYPEDYPGVTPTPKELIDEIMAERATELTAEQDQPVDIRTSKLYRGFGAVASRLLPYRRSA